jgi:hypothetical protein
VNDSNKLKFNSGGNEVEINSGHACYHSVQNLPSAIAVEGG